MLAATTVDDARLVYQAIRLARPGGLGRAPEQDVADEPTVTLREAMQPGRRPRPGRATVRATSTRTSSRPRLPALRSALACGAAAGNGDHRGPPRPPGKHPDTLIARKRGPDEAREASRRAAEVLAAGWPDDARAVALFEAFDGWLRADGHASQPRERRPTSSRPPCSPPCGMAQSGCPGPLVTRPGPKPSDRKRGVPFRRVRECRNRARLALQGPRDQRLPGLLLGTLHYLSRAISASACTATITAPPSRWKTTSTRTITSSTSSPSRT